MSPDSHDLTCYCSTPALTESGKFCTRCGGRPKPRAPYLHERVETYLRARPRVAVPLIGAVTILGLLALLLLASTDPIEDRATPAPASAGPAAQTESLAVSELENQARVRDAAASLDGRKYTLVIVVDYATSESYAKQLGDNFVRLIKSFSDDDAPGQSIGRGKYDYVVGVYYPNEERLVLGAKSRAADRISW